MALTDVAGETTLTGKNQVSLPARGVRQLGCARGDRLIVHVLGPDTLLLTRRPDNWTNYYAGKLSGVFGTHEQNLAFLAAERASWDHDHGTARGAADAPQRREDGQAAPQTGQGPNPPKRLPARKPTSSRRRA